MAKIGHRQNRAKTRNTVSMTLNDHQKRLCEESSTDYADLSALFLNCTLKPLPEMSHTEAVSYTHLRAH